MESFEILCVDTTENTNIDSSIGLKHALLFSNKLWKDPKDSSKKDNITIHDAEQGISLSIRLVETTDDDQMEISFLIQVKGAFESLEPFRYSLVKHLKSLKYDYIYVLTDDISRKIAVDIYPKLNQVENLLRRYLIKFFVTKLGTGWWNLTADQDMKRKVSSRKHNEKVFSEFVENSAYLIDFGELGKMIYTQSSGFTTREDIIAKVLGVATVGELEQLKTELESNYTKFFKESFKDEQFQSKWIDLEKIRHKVAHNNLFVKKDFTDACRLSDELINIIQKADENLDNFAFSNDEKMAIRDAIVSTSDSNLIISEERFLTELKEKEEELRLQNKQSAFVGLRYFVTRTLANKGFAIGPSYALANILNENHVIEIYDYIDAEERPVKAIRTNMNTIA